ncbi:MAG: hypothetical protein Q7U83_07440 [Daejeonella sp.]|nr:hypothetical protein [Daejeonella sp.]
MKRRSVIKGLALLPVVGSVLSVEAAESGELQGSSRARQNTKTSETKLMIPGGQPLAT